MHERAGRNQPDAPPVPPPANQEDSIARQPDENAEQDDADQAQDVAEDARNASTDLSEESERGGHPDPTEVAPADAPDLVERMKSMRRSGIIDNDAFAGEPQMDDEEDSLGPTDEEEE